MRQTIIIGGGTFNHVRNHLSLAAPAFGTVARRIHNGIYHSKLRLTKMADNNSNVVTNEDLSDEIDRLIADETVGTIVMSAAVCDYEGQTGIYKSGPHVERLHTNRGAQVINLTPADKIISRIRIARPDIFLVGFKTTTNASSDDQFLTALKFMKRTKCNLVLSNDVVTRNNMIVTPEETRYHESTNRNATIEELCRIIKMRQDLTYHRTNHSEMKSFPIDATPKSFQNVIQFLIDNGGFIENNGNGFTPGHFCYKMTHNTFLSSQRKADHNKVFEEGMTKVINNDGKGQIAFGKRKPSVGAMSQRLIFEEFPEYDCIIHTHNPVLDSSNIPAVSQLPFQCGSLECGKNTVNGMEEFGDGIAAVYLTKHGANILFKSTLPSEQVIDFIKANLELGVKES